MLLHLACFADLCARVSELESSLTLTLCTQEALVDEDGESAMIECVGWLYDDETQEEFALATVGQRLGRVLASCVGPCDVRALIPTILFPTVRAEWAPPGLQRRAHGRPVSAAPQSRRPRGGHTRGDWQPAGRCPDRDGSPRQQIVPL